MQNNKKIAIIGSGIAGLAAAWNLHKKYDIVLYEKASVLGGHAYTTTFQYKDKVIPIDLGVQLLHQWTYPNLLEMLRQFNVSTCAVSWSLAFSFSSEENWSNNFLTTFWDKIKDECNRFYSSLLSISNSSIEFQMQPLCEYLKNEKYSETFIAKALLPLLSTVIFSPQEILNHPLFIIVEVFKNNMISFFHPCCWHRVVGGTKEYISRLAENFIRKVRFEKEIISLIRQTDKVTVQDAQKNMEEFDEVIIATHADTALSMLSDPSNEERELLSSFQYVDFNFILHKDEGVLFSNIPRTALTEYTSSEPSHEKVYYDGRTYNVKKALELNYLDYPLIISLNPKNSSIPKQEKIIESKNYKHPLKPQDISTKTKIKSIQGKNHTWFCGLDIAFDSHEAAFVSGMVIAEALGASYPFSDKPMALKSYQDIKKFMGFL